VWYPPIPPWGWRFARIFYPEGKKGGSVIIEEIYPHENNSVRAWVKGTSTGSSGRKDAFITRMTFRNGKMNFVRVLHDRGFICLAVARGFPDHQSE
jgi:hypothetical protein